MHAQINFHLCVAVSCYKVAKFNHRESDLPLEKNVHVYTSKHACVSYQGRINKRWE